MPLPIGALIGGLAMGVAQEIADVVIDSALDSTVDGLLDNMNNISSKWSSKADNPYVRQFFNSVKMQTSARATGRMMMGASRINQGLNTKLQTYLETSKDRVTSRYNNAIDNAKGVKGIVVKLGGKGMVKDAIQSNEGNQIKNNLSLLDKVHYANQTSAMETLAYSNGLGTTKYAYDNASRLNPTMNIPQISQFINAMGYSSASVGV